jgi:hypothetical protein
MNRIAGYVNGYSCNINIDEIVNQILGCRFTESIPINQKVHTLYEAFIVAKNGLIPDKKSEEDIDSERGTNLSGDLYKELFEIVNSRIREKSKINY